MELTHALAIAERVHAALAPFCDRLEIAGSVRRRTPQVKDLELVAIPKQVPADLFGAERQVDPAFCAVVTQWVKVKGEPTGKYTQRLLPEGLKLDLFMADADSFGLIYAVRTGSADFSHRVLATQWVKQGYKSHGGRLMRLRDGQVIPIREEAELFALLGLPWVEPPKREVHEHATEASCRPLTGALSTSASS
jgi:DNA polymerase/3'-5' exonuclease PolX